MAASLLRANDTPFQQRKRVDAFPVQVPRVEALPDYDFCNDGNFGLTGFDDDAFSWQDMYPSFQYCGHDSSQWSPSTYEAIANPYDREESSFSDLSVDTFAEPSYTYGPPQPEELESESTAYPRLTCRRCSKKFENVYSLEQHAKVSRHRIFVCPIAGCDMSYTRRDSWTRHKRSHNLELRCDLCPQGDQKKTFKRKDHLLAHQRNCHPQQACRSRETSGPSRESGTASSGGEPRAGLKDIENIKREHRDWDDVLCALEERFHLNSSTSRDFAGILADLVTPQAMKTEL